MNQYTTDIERQEIMRKIAKLIQKTLAMEEQIEQLLKTDERRSDHNSTGK